MQEENVKAKKLRNNIKKSNDLFIWLIDLSKLNYL
jgi:hypothetical protein